jgi:molybdopterin/thiamine biosynthesis adenylyltransferase
MSTAALHEPFSRPHAAPGRRADGWVVVPSGKTAINLDPAARRPALIDGPEDAAARFAASHVTIVGAGSVGARVIDSLSRMGIGAISIVDPGVAKLESLLTHPLAPHQVGTPKARLAAERAAEVSSLTRVRYFEGAFEALPLDALAGATAVVIATDCLAAEVAVTQACLRFGVPHLQASVYGRALVAQVRLIPRVSTDESPCICCQFGARDWEDLDARTRFSCEGSAGQSALPVASNAGPSTMSFPHLCGTAADLAVGELIADLLDLRRDRDVGLGSSLEYCGFHGGTTRTRLRRNPDCPLEHSAWTIRSIDSPLAQLTPRSLLGIARDEALRDASIRADGHRFASRSACDCDAHAKLGRFILDGASPLESCPGCGEIPVLHPLYTYSDIPGSALADCLDETFAELGAGGVSNFVVRGPAGATFVRSAHAADVAYSEEAR